MRRQQLESFGRGPALLSVALRQFPKRMWVYRPSANRWTIHEIIQHLADSEVSGYICCRHFIAEPASVVLTFDAALWAGTLGYLHQSTREALRIIQHLRRITYELLVTLPEPVWEHTAEHPTQGRLNLGQWIEMQEPHILDHIDQMRQNYKKWLQTNPPRNGRCSPPSKTAGRSIKPDKAKCQLLQARFWSADQVMRGPALNLHQRQQVPAHQERGLSAVDIEESEEKQLP